VGIGMGIIFTKIDWDFSIFNLFSVLNIIIAVALAWVASVVFNDIYDKRIDVITNNKRPLIVGDYAQGDYIGVGLVLFGASIFYAAIINPKVAFLLMAYQALAWLYSAWPFRLKRFLGIASFISALASMLVVFAGFILVTPMENIALFPKRIFWLLFMALIFSLPIKDLKDIAGDKADKVYTIPVVFGQYWGKIIIGSGIFLSYFLSIIFLNEYSLLGWSIFLGGVSFWVVVSSAEGKKINNYNLIWWILALLIIYMFILMKLIFW
jgi:4-hydroxybenzoate polyprenyltransferase